MKNRLRVFAVCVLVAFCVGCAAYTAVTTKQPLDPALVQQDANMAAYLLKAGGCDLSAAAGVAAPVVSIAADAQGNQVLSAAAAGGAAACQMTVQPTALPAPAPANTPATPVPAAS